jgi:ubiquinone/menaquinone biosynthesis C-methylase UbiE
MLKLAHFFEKLEIKPEEVLSDLGCGVGATTLLLSKAYPQNIICAVDINRASLDRLQAHVETDTTYKNIKIIQADLEDPKTSPIANDMLDVALVENVLHTLQNPKAFIVNIKKMMCDGGRILVSDFEVSPLKTVSHQQMLLKQKDVERLFVEAGFLVYPIKIEDAHSFLFLAKKPDGRKIFINKN